MLVTAMLSKCMQRDATHRADRGDGALPTYPDAHAHVAPDAVTPPKAGGMPGPNARSLAALQDEADTASRDGEQSANVLPR